MVVEQGFGMRQGQAQANAQSDNIRFNKAIELNNKYRLFMRVVDLSNYGGEGFDIAAVSSPGRQLSLGEKKGGFCKFPSNMIEVTEAGRTKDLSGMQSWANVAKVLFEAAYRKEKKAVEDDAEKLARDLERDIDVVALSKNLEAVELQYHGGEAADGTKIYAKKSPFLSGIKVKVAVQVAVVRIAPDGVPELSKFKVTSFEPSNQRMDALQSLLMNPNYYEKGSEYLEVEIDYAGTDTAEAGRKLKFQGIAKSLSLAVQYPELWDKLSASMLSQLSDSYEVIFAKAPVFSRSKSVSEVVSEIKKYCATNVSLFTYIDFEDEKTKNAAKDFIGLGLVESLPKIKNTLKELVELAADGTEDSYVTTEEDKAMKVAYKVENSDAKYLGQIMTEVPDIGDAMDDDGVVSLD